MLVYNQIYANLMSQKLPSLYRYVTWCLCDDIRMPSSTRGNQYMYNLVIMYNVRFFCLYSVHVLIFVLIKLIMSILFMIGTKDNNTHFELDILLCEILMYFCFKFLIQCQTPAGSRFSWSYYKPCLF